MKFRVSVTDLIDFCCRSGDLRADVVVGPTALEGIRAHQSLQQQLLPEAETEVTVDQVFELLAGQETVALRITGRIDYLLAEREPPLIGEIKTVRVPADRVLHSTRQLHLAQLRIYGYLWLCQHGCTGAEQAVDLERVWSNIQDQSRESDITRTSLAELRQFADEVLGTYAEWRVAVEQHRRLTRESAASLVFPYADFRRGQRDMAAAIYRSVRDKGHLFVEAPTGIGKSISVLYAAIRALGDGHVDKLLYLTAKTSGRQAARQAARQMGEKGLGLSMLVISSKQLVCHCSRGACERDDDGQCPMCTGFFDRLPAARATLLEQHVMDESVLLATADRYRLCPFELSLQMIPWATLVICDYNYVFDPLVRLSCFSHPDKRTVLLLDEAHNLVDRSRSMYSASLSRQLNRRVRRQIGTRHPTLARQISSLGRALTQAVPAGRPDEARLEEVPVGVTRAVEKCLQAWVEEPPSPLLSDSDAVEWFRAVMRWQVIDSLKGDTHHVLVQRGSVNADDDTRLQLFCVDASERLNRSLVQFRSAILFSATLRPMHYFQRALGLPEETRQMQLVSPFDPARLLVGICSWIDVRYRQRGNAVDSLVRLLAESVALKPGNYMVFFPSYAFMLQVHRRFEMCCPEIRTVVQVAAADESERQDFLDRISDAEPVLGFAITGGVFAEGVDYIGDALIGCFIVGTGLPSLSLPQNLVADHFASQGQDRYDHGYRYPGLVRVLQAAGRVIRSESDKGFVLLIDQRFDSVFYRDLLPDHWQVRINRSPETTLRMLAQFWKTTTPGNPVKE